MRTAQKEMETIAANRLIQAAQPSSFFRVWWQEELNRYTGPYTVHGYDNEKTVYVKTDKIRPFSTSVVRFLPEENQQPVSTEELSAVQTEFMNEIEPIQQQLCVSQQEQTPDLSSTCEALLGIPESRTYVQAITEQGASSVFIAMMVKDKNDPIFSKEKVEEVEKLVKLGTFEVVRESTIKRNGTVLHSRFVVNI